MTRFGKTLCKGSARFAQCAFLVAQVKIYQSPDFVIYMSTRVNNKEGKRVSNSLYTPYKMFSDSHVPGIKKLTNQSARFKWYVVGVASSAS